MHLAHLLLELQEVSHTVWLPKVEISLVLRLDLVTTYLQGALNLELIHNLRILVYSNLVRSHSSVEWGTKPCLAPEVVWVVELMILMLTLLLI